MGELYSENLFRRQAIKALSKRPFGRPISDTPRPWLWLTALVVVLATIIVLFLVTAEYSRKESVRGWLVARNGVARITHSAPGIVESIAAASGQTVKAGDPVIYLSREKFLKDGRSSSDEMRGELATQIASIDRRMELLQSEADIEKNSITQQLRGLEGQANALIRQQDEQEHRLVVAGDKLLRLQSAFRGGAVAEWDLLRHQDEQATLRQTWNEMRQSEIALKREHERLTARAKTLPVETERVIARLISERSRLLQQVTEQESEQHVVLKSPITGKLASIEVHRGGAVAPNQLLATVLPENLKMIAEVFVPSSAIGFIKRGQRVRLMYDAFPQQKFGAFAGEVDRVSDFILMPSEVPQTFFLREATFKVQIAIQTDSVSIESGSARLRPGMLLAAEIILERRSLVDWLLEPIRLRRRDAA